MAKKNTSKPTVKTGVKSSTTTTTTNVKKTSISLSKVKQVKTKDTTSTSDEFDALAAMIVSMKTQLTAINKQLKEVRKRSERELRVVQKQVKKKKKNGARAPSGFVKPTRISDNLADFLHKPKGTELARTAVTREINAYIRKHNLQDPKNGRHILPDVKLRKLLGLKKTDNLTYFNLQRYMKPHFFKQVKKVTN